MSHKLMIVVCALALVLGLSLSASAAVQNVKVGGDIEIKGIYQSSYDIYKEVERTLFSGSAVEAKATQYTNDPTVRDYLIETVRLYVDASLTDNVGAYVRLIQNHDMGLNNVDAADDVEVDLAYLTLNEIYGYPFSMTFGRQELLYGEGFLVADGIRDTVDSVNQTYQYDTRKSFDAFKAVWSYDPHQIDLFVAKVVEGSNVPVGAVPVDTDNDLYGLNYNYDGGVYGAWDVGLFYNRNNTVGLDGENQTWALSVRGEGDLPSVSLGTLALKGELVKEWGMVEGPAAGVDSELLDAWAGYVEGEYTFDNPYALYFGLGYIYMGGDDLDTDDVEQFNPLFEGETYGQIAEVVYGQGASAYANAAGLNSADTTMTNASIWKLSAGLNPTENTNIDLTYYNLTANEEMAAISQTVGGALTADPDNQNTFIGSEYDVTFTYNYSEDVSFGLMYALFIPGKFFELGDGETQTDAVGDTEWDISLENAQELLGSVKVTF